MGDEPAPVPQTGPLEDGILRSMAHPKLLLPNEYVTSATEHIKKAKKRVSFLSMIISDSPATDSLIDALAGAAERGLDVVVAADNFTYGELGGHFIPLQYYTKRSRETTKMARALKKAGVKFRWLGRFSAMPFTGRTHTKCLIVDDTVYSFGGVNLHDENLAYTDYMFSIKDQQLALELHDEVARLIKADAENFSYRSHEVSYKDKSSVLVDGGFQADSLIYRRATQLAKEASEVLYVSQYCPAGRLAKEIKKVEKRKIYFNPPAMANPWNKLVIRTGMALSGYSTLYKRTSYLHAKFIIFTMADGTKTAITGSHNFMPGTVLFGTKEMALQISDKAIIAQLESFYKKHVA